MSVARVYPNVNTQRPKEYWDYESLAITWGCVPVDVLALQLPSSATFFPFFIWPLFSVRAVTATVREIVRARMSADGHLLILQCVSFVIA